MNTASKKSPAQIEAVTFAETFGSAVGPKSILVAGAVAEIVLRDAPSSESEHMASVALSEKNAWALGFFETNPLWKECSLRISITRDGHTIDLVGADEAEKLAKILTAAASKARELAGTLTQEPAR